MKYKVGDIVRIKSIDWYERNKNYYGYFKIDSVVFSKEKSKYCGKTAKITAVHSTYYDLDIDNGLGCWADYMFEDDFIPTRPIGSTFEHDGKTYKVIKGSCDDCSFKGFGCKFLIERGYCDSTNRTDHRIIIFKQIDKNDMETKVELKEEDGMVTKITIPDNCDFEVRDKVIIVTPKKVIRTWKDIPREITDSGFEINKYTGIREVYFSNNEESDNFLFASEKHAKSALAMAQISQLMLYYGGEVTDEEWKDGDMDKYIIRKWENEINAVNYNLTYFFLAFHTEQQRDDFLRYNEQLVKDYLMID